MSRWLRHRHQSGEITLRTRVLLEHRFRQLQEIHGDRPVCDLDRDTIRRWARAIGTLSPATRRAYQSTISGFCRWAVEEGLLEVDPTEKLPKIRDPRRVPRARPAADVTRILAAAGTARETLIVELMVEMGLRAIEVSRLQVGDYDPVARTMFIKGKGAHERVLPVPDPVLEALEAYRSGIGWRPGPLVCATGSTTNGLSAYRVAQLVTQLMRATGVKRAPHDGISAHALRHTAASDVLDQCGNVHTVQEMLGHASIATTQIYLRRASMAELRQAMGGRDYRASCL